MSGKVRYLGEDEEEKQDSLVGLRVFHSPYIYLLDSDPRVVCDLQWPVADFNDDFAGAALPTGILAYWQRYMGECSGRHDDKSKSLA